MESRKKARKGSISVNASFFEVLKGLDFFCILLQNFEILIVNARRR